MTITARKALLLGAIALAATAGYASVAAAQSQQTPKGWNYEIKDGKRVPKAGNRVTNQDGSWREEVRQGNCVTSRNGRRRANIRKPASAIPAAIRAKPYFASLKLPFGRCLIAHSGRPVPGTSLQSRTWALPSGPANTAQSRGWPPS